jgi:glutamate 5-kinase
MSENNPRRELAGVRRVVVKIGTKSITAGEAGRFGEVAAQAAALRQGGRELVLVSSGAIALGFPRLGLKSRPSQMAELQASAAAGQSRLMHAYEQAFAPYGIEVAQILLTHDGISNRELYLNARAALDALLQYGCVPIINENDTVAVEEIRFGDNDQLAAMVATLVGADLLVLLTDVEGLLDAAGARITVVQDVDAVRNLVRPHEAGGLSLGGMESKLEAARRASRRGLPVVIADARDPEVLSKILRGDDVGTLVLPGGARLDARKHWIAYALKPRGALVVDEAWARALLDRQDSLLPADVVGVRGDFGQGDPVSVMGPDGREIARGLSRYAMPDAAKLAGAETGEIEARIGHFLGAALIDRDDLVVL